jgi:hypothetical protein
MTDQRQLKNLEYLICFVNTITDDARGTREINHRIAMATAAIQQEQDSSSTAAFNKSRTPLQQQIGLKFYGRN